MSGMTLELSPHLPLWVLAVLAVPALALLALAAVRRARGLVWRALFTVLLFAALINPILHREEREALPDIALVVTDRSPSQRLAGRADDVDAAAAAVRERLEAAGGIEVREVETTGEDGTRLFGSMADGLAQVDRSRLGAVVTLSDGQVHDPPRDPADLRLDVPLHGLITGRRDENDRRLVIEQAPSFGVVGEPQSMTVRVDDETMPTGTSVPVTLRQDGRPVGSVEVPVGGTAEIPFRLDKAGITMLEVEASVRPGELSGANNRAAAEVNGVRDRLRVLVVSGQPYAGLRVWRNLLKADPAVDLVHFTILRPPEKQDGTPIRELALIAFPSRELFEVKLNEFDLIVFDRYSRRGLLPLIYLENIARYVEGGGALLEAAGPEFAEPTSLFRTPLARVLPGRPSGEVFERGYTPTLTDLGRRHPVTEGLQEADPDRSWGRWYRQVDVEAQDSQVLMHGVADRPLLMLKRVGEGRVAQLLSDQAWLWARGYEGGGPQATLLRRLVHWLMKEPSLEEEGLVAVASAAEPGGSPITVTRRALEPRPSRATVVSPSGQETAIDLTPVGDGPAQGRFLAGEDGLYRITDGEHTAYVTPRPIAPVELAEMRATDRILAPVAEATGGSVRWLEDGVPDFRHVTPGRAAEGRGWLGVDRRGAFRVTGSTETPLLPPSVGLLLLLAAAAATWWREGRG